MEKRLVIFLVCSVLIMVGYSALRIALAPDRPVAQQPAANNKKGAEPKKEELPGKDADGKEADKKKGADKKKEGDTDTGEKGAESGNAVESPDTPGPKGDLEADPAVDAHEDEPKKPVAPLVWPVLGSFAPDSPYRLMVTLTNEGAAVERVELVLRDKKGRLLYRDLDVKRGYLGLQCRTTPDGCLVMAVGPATPAALAKPKNGAWKTGLRVGDRIVSLDGRAVRTDAELAERIADCRPRQEILVVASRMVNGQFERCEFGCRLVPRPVMLIESESDALDEKIDSFLMGINRMGDRETRFGEDELPGVTSLRSCRWEIRRSSAEEVVFAQKVDAGADGGSLEFIKRYRLVRPKKGTEGDVNAAAYHLTLGLEIRNLGSKSSQVGFHLDGPNGLPTEGWWYSNKIHPSWGAAGARDVIWRVHDKRHSLRSASQIYKQVTKDEGARIESVLTDKPSHDERTLDYLGVDTQYFSAVLVAGAVGKPTTLTCSQAYAMPVGEVGELKGRKIRLLNSSFRLESEPVTIEAGKSWQQDYQLFLGPKSPSLLSQYGLEDIVEYGWFGFIARPLSKVLHFFYAIISNYGLAIILLTVLVRGAMFPVGRKAARNAQMMQQMAPEMKKIKEKYKSDMEKQAQAQRELWKKYNFNPLGGCWLMFLQMPIFIGLYRCLSVDIELRQASLIPGLSWCSNLAGPDMAFLWKPYGPGMLTSETGWLGPYFNILPVITIILFIAQQKLFTPPATDDQSKMQQSMMKYMMIFMGVLFFKVAAGLCLYFVASSLWGIAERKMLPPPDMKSLQEQKPKKKSWLERMREKQAPDRAAIARERRKRQTRRG